MSLKMSHQTQLKLIMSTESNMNAITQMMSSVPVPSGKVFKSSNSYSHSPATFKHIALKVFQALVEVTKTKKITRKDVTDIISGYNVKKIKVILTAIANELNSKTQKKKVVDTVVKPVVTRDWSVSPTLRPITANAPLEDDVVDDWEQLSEDSDDDSPFQLNEIEDGTCTPPPVTICEPWLIKCQPEPVKFEESPFVENISIAPVEEPVPVVPAPVKFAWKVLGKVDVAPIPSSIDRKQRVKMGRVMKSVTPDQGWTTVSKNPVKKQVTQKVFCPPVYPRLRGCVVGPGFLEHKRVTHAPRGATLAVKTRLCIHRHRGCTRKTCGFAHTLDELKPVKCRFGVKCRHGDKCKFMHKTETKEQYVVRIEMSQGRFPDDLYNLERWGPLTDVDGG